MHEDPIKAARTNANRLGTLLAAMQGVQRPIYSCVRQCLMHVGLGTWCKGPLTHGYRRRLHLGCTRSRCRHACPDLSPDRCTSALLLLARHENWCESVDEGRVRQCLVGCYMWGWGPDAKVSSRRQEKAAPGPDQYLSQDACMLAV